MFLIYLGQIHILDWDPQRIEISINLINFVLPLINSKPHVKIKHQNTVQILQTLKLEANKAYLRLKSDINVYFKHRTSKVKNHEIVA